MKKILLGLMLLFVSLKSSGQPQISPGQVDFCGVGMVTYDVISPVPGHQYTWYVFNYSGFNCTYQTGGMSVGTGTSVTVNLANYLNGASILVDERDQNGNSLGYLQQSMIAVVQGASIPICVDTIGCKEIRIPDAFVSGGSNRLKQWFQNGVPMQTPATSVIRGPFFGTQTFEYTLTAFLCGVSLTTGPVVINGPPRPAITATGSLVRCMGDSVLLSAPASVNGIGYWYFNNVAIAGTSGMPDIYAKTSGTYKLSATIAGCNYSFITDSLTVQFLPAPVVTGSNTGCNGDSVLLSTSGYPSYIWKRNGVVIPGATSPNIYVKQSGNYAVQTGTGTCGTSVPKIVTFYTWPVVTVNPASPVTLCAGQTLTLTATGTNIASCKWYRNNVLMTGATSTTLTITKNGNYKCIAANASGCTKASNTVQVTIPSVSDLPKKTIQIQPDSSGKDTYISSGQVNTNFGTNQYLEIANRYVVTAKRSLLQFNLAGIPSGSPVVSASLKLYTDTAYFNIGGVPQTLYLKRILQPWNESTVKFSSVLDSSNFQYSTVSSSGIISHTFMNVSITDLVKHWVALPVENNGLMLHLDESPAGNYAWLRFASSDNAVAANRPKLTVTYYYADITTTGSLNICNGGSVVFKTNPGNYTYQWFKNNTIINGATDSLYTATAAGNYKVVITNSAGCSVTSAEKTVTMNTPPVANVAPTGNTSFCHGSNLWLTADSIGGYTSFQWKLNGNAIAGATQRKYKATQAGAYTVVVTNSCAVTATSAATNCSVITNPAPTLSASGPTTFCNGQSVTFTANSFAGVAYQWRKNSVDIPGATAATYTATTAGAYQVKETANGCSRTSGTGNVVINCRTGLSQGNYAIINVYPQPFSNTAIIELETDMYECSQVSFVVTDINGKEVRSISCEGVTTILRREGMTAGIYFIQTRYRGNPVAVSRIAVSD